MDEAFFRRVEHDLRGELATMMAGLHYLLRYEKSLGSPARDMLGRVHGAGERLKRLLDEFGDAAWINLSPDRARHAIEGAPYDLSALIERALERIAPAVASRNVSVERSPGAVVGTPFGDAELLTSAVEYALDFAVARAPDSAITVRWEAAEGSAPVVTVTDRGGSVEQEQLERLLQPFVEQDVVAKPLPGTRKRDRLGLGLAIAQGILAGHGGALLVEHTPDKSGIVLRCVLGPPAAKAKRTA